MDKIYRWVVRERDLKKVEELKVKYHLDGIVAQILSSRGVKGVEEFLVPSLDRLISPFELKGVKEAKELIEKHIKEGSLITIYGDYDVDGITSTSLLYLALKKLGAKVDYYIPERLSEGYGINEEALEKIAYEGAKLVITVDCGITALKEVEKAKKMGLDVIITDHHSVPEEIPKADVVINPHLPGAYPFSELAGVGVAFKLAQALIGEQAFEFLDLVALGTVADIVPLIGENRVIVKEGLKRLNNTGNLGLKALIEIAGVSGRELDEYHIGFIIAPRLNAAGRLKSAEAAVRLLITSDEKEAQDIAKYLNEENLRRQNMENTILKEAIEKIEKEGLKDDKVIVLWQEGWHPGVIGIVSSKITEMYGRPSILIGLIGEEGKGSGRSVEGFNIYKALNYCKDLLVKYGGHEMAGGLTIQKENLKLFKDKINEYADRFVKEIDLVPALKIDAVVKKDKADLGIAKKIQQLKPFGVGNPKPLLLFEGLTIDKIFDIKDGKHIKILAKKDEMVYELLIFNSSSDGLKISEGDVVDAVGTLEISHWNGIESAIVNVKDIRVRFPLFAYYRNLSKSLIYKKTFKLRDEARLKANIVDRRGIQDKEKYVLHLFKSPRKTLILVNTEAEFRALIRYLKKEKFYDFSVSAGYCEEENLILFSPFSLEKCDFYEDIVIYDIPFDRKVFYDALSFGDRKRVHLVFNKKDLHKNLKVFDEILPSRDDFIKIYKFIDEGNKFFFKGYLNPELNLNPVKFAICLEVMKETGLINVEERDNIVMLSKNFVPEKVNLKEAEILQKFIEAKKEFLDFAKFAFKPNFREVKTVEISSKK